MLTLRTIAAQAMNPKTPPSTPFLEKGPTSNSKRSKPIYGTPHRPQPSTLYTRFLHAVIVLLLFGLTALYRLHAHPDNTFPLPLPWAMNPEHETTTGAEHDRDITAQLRACPLVLSPDEILCIGNTDGVLAPADPAHLAQAYGGGAGVMGPRVGMEGDRQAWVEMQGGLEGLWGRLVESRCTCENAEGLDRIYEGLRERARLMGGGAMGGEEGGVAGVGGM